MGEGVAEAEVFIGVFDYKVHTYFFVHVRGFLIRVHELRVYFGGWFWLEHMSRMVHL